MLSLGGVKCALEGGEPCSIMLTEINQTQRSQIVFCIIEKLEIVTSTEAEQLVAQVLELGILGRRLLGSWVKLMSVF